jgi:hypothetical protein
MKLHYITDVNKPGHNPEGGWWYVISGEYHLVTGKRHARKESAQRELKRLEGRVR